MQICSCKRRLMAVIPSPASRGSFTSLQNWRRNYWPNDSGDALHSWLYVGLFIRYDNPISCEMCTGIGHTECINQFRLLCGSPGLLWWSSYVGPAMLVDAQPIIQFGSAPPGGRAGGPFECPGREGGGVEDGMESTGP